MKALRAVLPEAVLAELDTLTVDAMPAWAARHGINAPCVIEAFSCFCSGGWKMYGRFTSESWKSPRPPDEWLAFAGGLNQRPVDLSWVTGMYGDIADRPGLKAKEPFRTSEALRRCLAPIATDPTAESLDEFVARARLHWMARGRLARSFGARPAGLETEWPNLARDIDWLIRYQVRRESHEAIADADGIEPETVKKAIDRVARIIELKRPRGRAARAVRQTRKRDTV